MTIIFNTDNNIIGTDELQVAVSDLLTEKLSRYSDQITRIEVHYTDENGPKEGANDKRVMLEARVEGRAPVAITVIAESHDLALQTAIDKLKSALDKAFGRMNNR